MAGEDFLKFNNGQKFSFSNFKEIKEEDLKNADAETKRLFNIFAGNDKILQANEAQSLWNKLKTAATTNKNGDNSVFDSEEMQNFLSNNEISSDSKFNIETLTNLITQIFATPKVQETTVQTQITLSDILQSKEKLTEQELQQVAVQTLDDDSSRARALFDKQNREQGPVSNASNWVKELFNTEYAKTQVDRVLMIEDFSAFLIKKASTPEGITKKEYYEAKIEFIIQLVKKFDKSIDEANLDASREALKDLSPKRIDSIIQSIATLTDECTPQDIVECIKNKISKEFEAQDSLSKQINMHPENITQELADKPSDESLANMDASGTLNKKMTFREAFRAERGVAYNKEAINDYALKNAQFEILSKMHNTVSLIEAVSNEIVSVPKNEASLTDTFNNLISSIYGENISRAKEDLADNGLSFDLQDGKISVSQDGLPLTKMKALSLLTKL